MARKTQEEMFPLMEAWEQSASSREVFCTEHHLSLSTFSYWRSRYLRVKASDEYARAFVKLQPASTAELEVIYPNGVRLRVPAHMSLSDLQALIQLV